MKDPGANQCAGRFTLRERLVVIASAPVLATLATARYAREFFFNFLCKILEREP